MCFVVYALSIKNIGKTITIWWNFINETLSEDYSIIL